MNHGGQRTFLCRKEERIPWNGVGGVVGVHRSRSVNSRVCDNVDQTQIQGCQKRHVPHGFEVAGIDGTRKSQRSKCIFFRSGEHIGQVPWRDRVHFVLGSATDSGSDFSIGSLNVRDVELVVASRTVAPVRQVKIGGVLCSGPEPQR